MTNLATGEQSNTQEDTPSRSPIILRPYVHCELTHNGPIASTLLRICYTSHCRLRILLCSGGRLRSAIRLLREVAKPTPAMWRRLWWKMNMG